MEKYYENEIILKQITARLVPPNNNYPDCVCKVLLTEDFLYVLEDNFDGTHKCMFKIPFKKLLSVEKYIAPENTNGPSKKDNYSPGYLSSAVMALCGIIFIPIRGKQSMGSNEFLKITYKNEHDVTDCIFFEDCSSIENMVNTFEKYKY